MDLPSVTYRIEHTTRYEYGALVSTSQHVACLQPRTLPGQRLDAWALAIDPTPARVTAREDYFGNTLHYVTLMTPHDELRVSSQSTVDVSPRTLVDPAGDRVVGGRPEQTRVPRGAGLQPCCCRCF